MAYPLVSQWASFRLPSCPRFHKPPCDPGRWVFPSPVLTLAFFRGPSQIRGEAQALTYIHPAKRWFTHKLVLASSAACSRHCVRAPHWDRQVPRAPLPPVGVTAGWEMSCISSAGVTPPSSLIRAHAPDHCPPPASGFASCEGSLQVAASPCCATVLPDAISADLSVRVWTPTPVAPRVLAPVSSPRTLAFPAFEPGRRITNPPTATSVGQ